MRTYTLLGSNDFLTTTKSTDKMVLGQRIGIETIQDYIGHFMGSIYKNGIPAIDELLPAWFQLPGLPYTKNTAYPPMAAHLEALQNANPGATYQLISAESLLRVFLWLRENQDQLTIAGTARPKEKMNDLFAFLLLFNDEVNANIATAKASARLTHDVLLPYREILALSFPSNDLENVELGEQLACQIDKATRLLTFMENTPKYQALHAKLLADFGCATNADLIQRIGGIILTTIRQPPGKATTIIPPGANFEDDINLFERLAIQPSNAPAGYSEDFLELRKAPIYKVAEGEYRVTSESFLINVIYNGITKYCSGLCLADPTLLNGNANLPGEIRMDFSEGVLLYDMGASIFDQPQDIKYTGQQMVPMVGTAGGEPDYYAARANRIAIFESKDVYMTGPEKLSYDFPTIEAGLTRGGRISKGAKQLAKNTLRVLNGQLPTPPVANPYVVDIYPILLVHSSLYSCHTFNFWANQWFDQEMDRLIALPVNATVNRNRVKPLTVVEIDTMILFEDAFKAPAFDFLDLVEAYHAQVGMRGIPAGQAQAAVHAGQQISFAEFIRLRARQLGIIPNIDRIMNQLAAIGIV